VLLIFAGAKADALNKAKGAITAAVAVRLAAAPAVERRPNRASPVRMMVTLFLLLRVLSPSEDVSQTSVDVFLHGDNVVSAKARCDR